MRRLSDGGGLSHIFFVGEMSVKEINYILKRVLQMIPVLLLVMVLIFALIRFIPATRPT